MMKRIPFVVLVTILVAAIFPRTTGLHALDVPPLTGRVVDRADMITPSAEREITAYLQSVEESTGAQIAVLTVPGLDGEVLEEYSIRVVDQWKLGAADRDNGVLLLVAAAEKKIRLEVGYGLEGVLTDAKSGLIIREIIQPHFQRGNFDRGILEAVQVVGGVAAGDENAVPSGGRSASATAAGPDGGILQAIGELLFTAFVVFFVFGIGAMGRRRRYGGFGRALFWGMLLSNAGRHRSTGASRYRTGGFGGGGFGGGGFGGFSGGGGGFGGGGASGGW